MGYFDSYGIDNDELREAVEKALYAARDSLAESLTELEMVDEATSFDNASGLVIHYGEGIRIDLGEHGEIDIEINVDRFQTKQQLDEEAAMYGDDDENEIVFGDDAEEDEDTLVFEEDKDADNPVYQ